MIAIDIGYFIVELKNHLHVCLRNIKLKKQNIKFIYTFLEITTTNNNNKLVFVLSK
jgi:hypothetical protein